MAEAATANTNNPPPDADPLRERLASDHAPLLTRADELIAALARIPAEIDSDELAGRAGDFQKQVGASMKALDAARVGEKEPYLAGSRSVDGFFKRPIDALEAVKSAVNKRLTDYLRKKAEAERRAREEEERKAREAAEAARKDAEAKAAAAATDADLDAAVSAESLARQAEADAAEATRYAEAKPADLARTRGEHGGLATLRTEWSFDQLDRARLDLERLRPFIPTEALEKAIRAFVRAGGRKLRGVRIHEAATATVR